MTAKNLDDIFRSAFHLTELQCLLQNTVTIPSRGYAPAIYLSLRARIRSALKVLPRIAARSDLEAAANAGLELSRSRSCFDVDIGDPKQPLDARAGIAEVIRLNRERGSGDGKLRVIESRCRFDLDMADHDAMQALMLQSVEAAANLDVAMGELRNGLDRQPSDCFTAGWAISVIAAYATAFCRFAEFLHEDNFPTKMTLVGYRIYLERLLGILPGILAGLDVPDYLEVLICLNALRTAVELYDEDRTLKEVTVRAIQTVAVRALAARGMDTIFTPLLCDLETMYSSVVSAPDEKVVDAAEAERRTALDAESRYLRSRQLAELNNAIAAATRALAMLPEASFCRALCNETLSKQLFERYMHGGDLTDIDQAATALLASLTELPNSHILVPTALANLGYMLTVRFDRTQTEDDLDMAIDALEQVVDRKRGPVGRQSYWWANLANALRLRAFYCSRDIADFDDAIDLYKTILKVTPSSSPDYATFQQNLANTEFNRADAEHQSGHGDIDRHVEVLRGVVKNLPYDHADLSTALGNLGCGLRRQALHKPDVKREAMATLRRAIDLSMTAALPQALDFATQWGQLAFACREWDEAVEAYGRATAAIEQLFRVQLTRSEQSKMLSSAQGIASDLAYALARAGRLDDAVVTIEAGLAKMLADALEKKRIDLALLRDRGFPSLFDSYQSVVGEIAEAMDRSRSPGAQSQAALIQRLEVLRRTLDDVILRIRRVPGFERFLSKMNIEEIRAASTDPLVYMLATEQGGLALIVAAQQDEPVVAVDLPAMNRSWVIARINDRIADQERFLASGRTAAAFQEWASSLETLLADLWQVAMEPVVRCLQGASRATLVPVGSLQLLPLHAAGGARYALDILDIFYAPNAYALTTAAGKKRERNSIVAVQVSDSAHDPLPWTDFEIDLIKSYFPTALCIANAAATPRQVLPLITDAPLIHFSCHGSANLLQPLQSGLVLANGEALTVGDLMNAGSMSATLAVLLACETGVAGIRLPDEIVSLPTALQQAGTSAVIATLWSIGDQPSAFLAGRFYYNVQKEGMELAEAFVQALRWLRQCTWLDIADFTLSSDVVVPASIAAHVLVHGKQRPYAHPIYWAALYWTGSTR